jgi:hypothetical protein
MQIFRKTYSLKDNDGKRWLINKNSALAWIKRHETHIVDNNIRLNITEKLKNPTKANVQVAIKTICEATHRIPEPPSAAKIQESHAFLEKMWADYQRNIEQGTPASLEQFAIEKQMDTGTMSTIQPDHRLANLPLKLQNDPFVLFMPEQVVPTKPEELKILTDRLQAAFTSGKELVVIRLSTNRHAVLGAFSINGKFKLIDSMSSQVIDHKQLERNLNQAQVLGKNGTPIPFHGEYINTRIQKGGNTCLRICTLYAYHIAKKRNLEAYQEVNGAFLDGRLNTFEDYMRIDGASRKKIVSTTPASYAKFMDSWAYRSYGYAVDHWHQLPLSDLAEGKLTYPYAGLTCIKLDGSPFPKGTCTNPELKEIQWEFGVDKGDGIFIPIHSIDTLELEEVKFDRAPQTLGEVIPKDKSIRYIFCEKDNTHLKIVHLRPGEKLMQRLWDKNKSEPDLPIPMEAY